MAYFQNRPLLIKFIELYTEKLNANHSSSIWTCHQNIIHKVISKCRCS